MKKNHRLLNVAFLMVFIFLFNLKNVVLAQSKPLHVEINWKKVEAVSQTSLSIQVCPEPPMRRGHPASKNIYKSLRDMKVDYARLQPWYPYPRLGVAELEPPENGKTSWDFSVIDPIVIDFMNASEGRPVMLNFSTIPQWMIKTDTAVAYPSNPDAIAWGYSPGNQFRDTTLKELVGYYHRLLSWYTKGGFTDEYGKYHRSGYHFKIAYWEVLNENDQDTQHLFSPQQLVKIYDAVVSDLKKLNPEMKFSALALAFPDKGEPYVSYFLNAKNHMAGIPLDMFSYHYYVGPTGDKWEQDAAALEKQEYSYFENIDGFLKTTSRLDSVKRAISPKTKTYINELGTLPVGNPSDPDLVIPDFYWPISNALFAYAYANLVKQGIDVLAIAELIDYPGQFAGTTITDWNTGLPNARYWGMKLLKENFGLKDKLVSTTQPDQTLFAQGFITAGAKHKVLMVNKSNHIITVKVPGANGGRISFVDGSTGHRPAKTILLKNENIVLQAHAVAVITLVQ